MVREPEEEKRSAPEITARIVSEQSSRQLYEVSPLAFARESLGQRMQLRFIAHTRTYAQRLP